MRSVAAGLASITLFTWICRAASPSGADAERIVRLSVAAMNRNWRVAPEYGFVERDVVVKGGRKTVQTNQVLMIEGSPYYRVLAIEDRALSAEMAKKEREKMDAAIAQRRRESRAERQSRISSYQNERKQDHMLMQEMAAALEFNLTGREVINGREAYVLAASPRPGYRPKDLECRVLTGMGGRLWVDVREYQWIKVEAEVIRPVSFGLFIARVQPGTRFALEQFPVDSGVWLPRRFQMQTSYNVLWWQRSESEDESYRSYTKGTFAIASVPPDPGNLPGHTMQ